MAQHILVLHGPNLNLLGTREPDIYGRQTLADINQHLAQFATENGAVLTAFQRNHQGELVDRLQAASTDQNDFIIIKSEVYPHTSIALRDALTPSEERREGKECVST